MTPDLAERVSIERVTQTTDDMGGATEVWAEIAEVWADVKGVGGRESWQAMRNTGAAQYKAILRWQEDEDGQPCFTNLDRLKWRGRTYRISVVLPKGKRKEWIELALIEGRGS